MIKQLVESWRIQERRQIVSQRGLSVWPHDQPDDLEQIEQTENGSTACGAVVLDHPLHPLKMLVARGFSPRMAYYFALRLRRSGPELTENDQTGDKVLSAAAVRA